MMLGHVHGPESWSTTLWHMPGQSSLIIREVFFKLKKLNTEESAPPGRGRNKSKFFRKHVGSRGAPAIPVLTLPDEDIFKLPGSGVVSTSVEDSPRIHFTVRILMAQRKQPCILLENLTNIRHGDEIAWVDVTGARGILEDVPTAWESWLFRQWIKREEHLFNSEPSDSAERFTRFLHPYRREGERPRKAFFSPAPRASSVDRSRKIKDADDMVSEASEKAPDLTQSRSSAATSVNSGVRYYLDLEYEGFLPERYRKSGIEHGMDRSFYRPKAER
ncbi:hypothetical protein EJ04DRAFT_104635 [Polyplosphaeria fusca]|uniref:Uncharacterized protein n=1 Tax=Polyplosphaeria fusca TaxID=682080 RepID=A0A9P4QL09_9PLEO|nr:hypothetical protein EJ04DRAFT_104635 [Polyplosphaeria fusca]